MSTYTLSPVADANLDHLGFYAILIACAVLLCLWAAYTFMDNQYVSGKGYVTVLRKPPSYDYYIPPALLLCFVAFSAWVSWYPRPVPVNERVIGVRTGTGAAVGEERVGKTTQLVTSPYITYEVPEGVVTFKMTPGYVWPDRVVLYRN